MLSKFCRELARGEDPTLTAHGVNRLTQLVRKHQHALDRSLPIVSDAAPPVADPHNGKHSS